MYIPEPRKNKNGTWSIQLRVNKTSMSINAESAKECRHRAAIIKAEALAATRPVKKSDLTLTQAIDAYIKKLPPDTSPATIRSYRSIQKNRFPNVMGKKVQDLASYDWKQEINNALRQYAKKTVKNSWGLIKSVLDENGVHIEEKFATDRRPKKKKKYVWLEPDEIRRFVAAAKDDPLCVPMLLALMSMRIAEIDALRWENIQPDADFIQTTGTRIMDEHNQWVEQEEYKTEDSDRQVPLIIPELRAAIKRDWKPEGKLLEVHQMTLRRAVDRTCAKAGVKRVTVHQLRHSFASLSAHLGIPKEISMEIGGWSNDKIMNEIYTHIARSDIERYRNRMWSFYNANAEAPSNALQCTSQ